MLNNLEDAGLFINLDVAGKGGGNVLVVHGDETGEGHAGKGKGAHGFVDLVEVFGEETGLVGVLHEILDVIDDVVNVEKLGSLEGSGVADARTFKVETMLEGVEIAGLGTPFALNRFGGLGDGVDNFDGSFHRRGKLLFGIRGFLLFFIMTGGNDGFHAMTFEVFDGVAPNAGGVVEGGTGIGVGGLVGHGSLSEFKKSITQRHKEHRKT